MLILGSTSAMPNAGRPARSVRAGAGAVRCIPIASPPVLPLARPQVGTVRPGPPAAAVPVLVVLGAVIAAGVLAEDIAHFITTYGGDTFLAGARGKAGAWRL
jgi:hypothetical protein